MYRAGHYGAALLAYAPVGFVVASLGHRRLAVVGGALVLALTPLPDYDQRVPLIDHRGITHTVAFALLVGAVVGAGGWVVGQQSHVAGIRVTAPVLLGGFGALVGTLAILAHLAADVITPAGLRPWWPVSDRHHSLELVRAANPVANYLLLGAGVLAAGGVASLVGTV